MASFLLRYKKIIQLWLLALACSFVAFGCASTDINRQNNWAAYEAHFPAHTTAQPNVMLVEIDEASLKQFGGWPLDRSLYARAARNALASGAAVVAIDVMFETERSPDGDAQLAELAREDKRVVFAYQSKAESENPRFFTQLALAGPTEGYIDAVGSISHEVSSMFVDIPGETSFVMVVAKLYCENLVVKCKPAIRSSATDMVYRKRLADVWGINIHAPHSILQRVPFRTLVSEKMQSLQGKIVVLAPAAPSLNDLFWIPQGSRRLLLPGSIAIAYGIETAISGTAIFVLPAWILVMLIWACNGLVLCMHARLKSSRNVLMGTYLFVHFFAHWAMFKWGSLHLPISILIVNAACVWVVASVMSPVPASKSEAFQPCKSNLPVDV